MNFGDVLLGVYLTVSAALIVAYYRHNRLYREWVAEVLKQNDLLTEQNKLLRGIVTKYGLDISE